MALVKHTQTDRLLKDAVVLDLGDLKRQAARITQEAEAEAARILTEAQAEARRLVEESKGAGFEEGHAQGLADGRAAGHAEAHAESLEQYRQQLDMLQENWGSALEHWTRQREGMLMEAREDVLRFAFTLAEKVVHRVIELEPRIVVDQLEAALAHVGRPTSVRIHVHPDDMSLVHEVFPELQSRLASGTQAELLEDESVGRGGCAVRTEGGAIDAGVEMQLNRIARTLLPSGPEPEIDELEPDRPDDEAP